MASLGYGPGAPHGTPTPPKVSPSGSRQRKRPPASRALRTLQRSKKVAARGNPRRAATLRSRAKRQLNRSVGAPGGKVIKNRGAGRGTR